MSRGRPPKYSHEKYLDANKINVSSLPEDIQEVIQEFTEDKKEVDKSKLDETLEEVSRGIVEDIEEWLDEEEDFEEEEEQEAKILEKEEQELEEEAEKGKEEENKYIKKNKKVPLKSCGCKSDHLFAVAYNSGHEMFTKEELKSLGCTDGFIFGFVKLIPKNTKNFKLRKNKDGMYKLSKKDKN